MKFFKYHKNPKFLDKVKKIFGQSRKILEKINKVKLKRKILEKQ